MATTVKDISFAPYEIHSPHDLNARETNFRRGFLLQVVFADGISGYCDFHIFDSSDTEPVFYLKKKVMSKGQNLSRRLLRLARRDAEARFAHRSLLSSQVKLPSHLLIQDLTALRFSELETIWEMGFRHLKIKLGRGPGLEQGFLLRLRSYLKDYPFQLRFDFNAINTPESWEEWHHWLLLQMEDNIDFVEDPLPWDEAIWKQSKIPLALDLEYERAVQEGSQLDFLRYLVVKPALLDSLEDEERAIRLCHQHKEKILVTHMMDHPLGQMSAALWAVENQITSIGGYLNGSLRDTLGFYQEMPKIGPFWSPAPGRGLGFDESLKKIIWKKL